MTDLPAGVHTADLTGTDSWGNEATYTVVWADRPYDTCPRCGESVTRTPECPVVLDRSTQGLQVETVDLAHGCGDWLRIRWEVVGEGETVADRVAAQAAADVTARRGDVMARLRRELADALGADPEDAITGSETEPGVYRDGGVLVAWDHDPAGGGEILEVTRDDLDD